MDLPNTRGAIKKLPTWVNALASGLPEPVVVSVQGFGHRWEHREKSIEVAQVTKAVRMSTALRGALALLDLRLTTEACSLLRMVGDFSNEILFLGEAMLEGRLTTEQRRFVEQHFETLPLSPEALAELERTRYEGRNATGKALDRLMDKWKGPKEAHSKVRAYLERGYDRYVHGKYGTAMELFNPRTKGFMLTGSTSIRQYRSVGAAVAGKTVEGINSLRFMAVTRRMNTLDDELRSAAEAIFTSRESGL